MTCTNDITDLPHHQIESESAEPVVVTIEADADPTGDDSEFQLTDYEDSDASPTGSWSTGTWTSTWNSSNRQVAASSPAVGKSGTATLVGTQGSRYVLWIRWGTVVKPAAIIEVT